jgi:hypothetical protein
VGWGASTAENVVRTRAALTTVKSAYTVSLAMKEVGVHMAHPGLAASFWVLGGDALFVTRVPSTREVGAVRAFV